MKERILGIVRVSEEIDIINGRTDPPTSIEALNSHLLEQIAQETVRYFPEGFFSRVKAEWDIIIPVDHPYLREKISSRRAFSDETRYVGKRLEQRALEEDYEQIIGITCYSLVGRTFGYGWGMYHGFHELEKANLVSLQATFETAEGLKGLVKVTANICAHEIAEGYGLTHHKDPNCIMGVASFSEKGEWYRDIENSTFCLSCFEKLRSIIEKRENLY